MAPERDDIWLAADQGSLEEFAAERTALQGRVECPHAAGVEDSVPVYDARGLRETLDEGAPVRPMMAEWTRVLLEGPGVLVFKGAVSDRPVLEEATALLDGIIQSERERGAAGDHFAASGANFRVWNSHEKLCLEAPEVFARYNANDVVPSISRAWLGPLYQVTAQVNVVGPGAEAQRPHRDFHMGFQTPEQLLEYPAHVHRLSPFLTLQGAVAHCDMPRESGPTKVLTFSQRFLPGYLAALRPDFQAYFEEHHVQLPLEQGDMLFFNPAVLHAAGANRTSDVVRMANLLQISSAYGRAMETVDRSGMCEAVYPVLLELKRSGGLSPRELDNVVAATAEGYPFPANLDRAPPVSGMAPPSQQDLLRAAMAEEWGRERFRRSLEEHSVRRASR